MFHQSVCTTCGYPTGDIAVAFVAWCKKIYKSKLEQEDIKLDFAHYTNVDIDISEVFRELHVDYPCCRMHLKTTFNFLEVYNS